MALIPESVLQNKVISSETQTNSSSDNPDSKNEFSKETKNLWLPFALVTSLFFFCSLITSS
jgi:hypothetical protein